MILVIFSAFAIKTSWFQTFLGDQAARYLSYEWDTEVSIEKIDIDFFREVNLKGVFVRDLHGDTLISAPHIYAAISNFSLKGGYVHIKQIELRDANLNLRKYATDSVINFQFIVDYFSSDAEIDSKPFELRVSSISVVNTQFRYNNDHKTYREYGVDFDHIELNKLNLGIENFYREDDRFFANIIRLSLDDRSGFMLDELSARVKFSPRKMSFDNLVLKTPETSLDLLQLTLDYGTFENFRYFVDSVKISGSIVNSRLHLNDLAYFAPQFRTVNEKLTINGDIHGIVNELSLDNLVFGITKASYIKGSGTVSQITHPEDTYFDFRLKELSVNKADVESLDLSGFGVDDIVLPNELNSLGQTRVAGEIKGTYSDFYLKANVITNQGGAFAELNCTKPKDGVFAYVGWVDAVKLNVGGILGDETVGEITAHLNVNGRGITLKDLFLDISGHASSAHVMGYTYSNIKFPKAHVENKIFEGLLTIEDKNIGLNFSGKVDMASPVPQFNFRADVSKAHLHDIKLPVKNTTTSLCGLFIVNGTGKNLNEFDGKVSIYDIAIYQDGKDYEFNALHLDAQNNPGNHVIKLTSDFIDSKIEGRFTLDSIGYSFIELASHVFPSLFTERETNFNTREKFDFDIEVKDLSVVTDFFLPRLNVAEGTILKGSFNSEKDDFNFTMECDWLTFGNMRLDSISITTDKIVDLYAINLNAKDFLISEKQVFNNPALLFSTYDENINIGIRWNDADSARWGDVKMLGFFPDVGRFEFSFKDSQFYTIRNKWNIVSGSELFIDTTSIHLQNFTLYAEDQTASLNGVISENVEDVLQVELANFDLRQLNILFEPYGYSVKGRVEASCQLSDLYNNIYFDADTYLSEFKVNNEYLGDVWSKISWDRIHKDFKADGTLSLSGINQLRFNGVYHVMQKEDNLDFNLFMNDLNLKPYNVFLPEALTSLKGNVDGNIKLNGTPDKPDFSGKMTMKNVGANITLLNTAYTTSGDIYIDNDLIYMNYLPIRDANGKRARINGAFYHEYFKNYNYEFSVDMPEPFLCLNTSYDFNNLYYGTAYATGDVMVSYDKIRELEIKVKARTEKGTSITLPLYGAKEVVLQDFVTFVVNDSIKKEDEIDLTGINMEFNLDVTKDAEFEIVFDELVGDKITGSGSGNILMEIDKYGTFNMYGQFEIDRGDYLFTLQDVINKKFIVEKGGTISWYGDPYNADININALYNTRASLYDVMSEDVRERYRNKSEVDVVMNLSNSLFNPDLMFDIRLPRADENARAVVRSLIDTDEEKNKQVFSLLILNRFLPRMDVADNTSGGLGLGGTITSELLSTQLSSWLSKLTGETELGVNYRSGDDVSSSEVAVQLSRQFLDNNLTVSGNFGVAQNAAGGAGYEKQSQMIGDVLLEYKLTEEVRLKAFNQSNQFDITRNDQAPFTQGIGISYQKNFNKIREVMPKFLKRKNKKEGNPETATKPEEEEKEEESE